MNPLPYDGLLDPSSQKRGPAFREPHHVPRRVAKTHWSLVRRKWFARTWPSSEHDSRP